MQDQNVYNNQLAQILSGEYKLYDLKVFLCSVRQANQHKKQNQIIEIEQLSQDTCNKLIFSSPQSKKHISQQQNTFSPMSGKQTKEVYQNQQIEQKLIKKYQKLFQEQIKDKHFNQTQPFQQKHNSNKNQFKDYSNQKHLPQITHDYHFEDLLQLQDVMEECSSHLKANIQSISILQTPLGASRYYFGEYLVQTNMKSYQKQSYSQQNTKRKEKIFRQRIDKTDFKFKYQSIAQKNNQKVIGLFSKVQPYQISNKLSKNHKQVYKRCLTEDNKQVKFQYTEIYQRKNQVFLQNQVQILQQQIFYKYLKQNVSDDITMWYEQNRKKIKKVTQKIYNHYIINKYIQASQMNVRLNQLLMLKVNPDRWESLMAESAYAKLKNRFL